MTNFIEELERFAYNYSPIVKGNTVWIKCPFHSQGQERTPSCCINLIKSKYPAGFWYCFGCGKHGTWNDLCLSIPGLTPLTDEEIKHQDLIITNLTPQQKQELLGVNSIDFIKTNTAIPWNKEDTWRKINGKLLNKIGATKFYNEDIKISQLFLPCKQNNIIQGGIKAMLERKPGQHGYFNTPGAWVKKTLFPYDFTKGFMKTHGNIVALVEGPRDALNLIQGNFPALAILGSKNWSNFKRDLVFSLNPDYIVLAFDNDEAGQLASSSVYDSIKDYQNIVKLKFKPGQDPGDLTLEEIRRYYNKVLACKI